MRRLASFLIALTAATAACGDTDGASEPAEQGTLAVEQRADESEIIALALEDFGERFSDTVRNYDYVVFPSDINVSEVRSIVDADLAIEASPRADNRPYWRVTAVLEQADYWEITIAFVEGEIYFEGPLFYRPAPDGSFVRIEAEEAGKTVITSVS